MIFRFQFIIFFVINLIAVQISIAQEKNNTLSVDDGSLSSGSNHLNNLIEGLMSDFFSDEDQLRKDLSETREFDGDDKEFEDAYGSDPYGKANRSQVGSNERWKCFGYEEIANRDFRLDMNWLKDESSNEIDDLAEPGDLANEAIEELQNAIHALNKIIQSINS